MFLITLPIHLFIDTSRLNWCLKTLKTVKECTFMKMHCRFIFWLLIILSYRHGFNWTWLNITELMPKNIENCKRIQTKKRFHIFVSACLRKCTVDLSFDCRLFYPTELILTQHGSTLLNWCLKTLKTVKKFKQRNVSKFLWVHVSENALLIYLLIVDYFILPNWF